MKMISGFIGKFNTNISLNQKLIVKKSERYYLLSENLERLITGEFFYAGTYLGKVKDKTFFPSFSLLTMIAQTNANKVIVDKKAEWLFICGRDIFKRGIIDASKLLRKGDYTLILNERGDCLGFGRILHNIGEKDGKRVVVRNIADVGDFLRREK
jgi:ribosome biogenesis protein Nip4